MSSSPRRARCSGQVGIQPYDHGPRPRPEAKGRGVEPRPNERVGKGHRWARGRRGTPRRGLGVRLFLVLILRRREQAIWSEGPFHSCFVWPSLSSGGRERQHSASQETRVGKKAFGGMRRQMQAAAGERRPVAGNRPGRPSARAQGRRWALGLLAFLGISPFTPPDTAQEPLIVARPKSFAAGR